MSRLVASQASKKKEKKYVCDFCLNMFGSQALLDDHTEYCSKHDAMNVVMPKPERNILKFKNVQNSIECPVKMFGDFEGFMKSIYEKHEETKLYQRHVPSAFCLYVVSRVESFSMDPITYVSQGEDDRVDKVFAKKLEEVTKKIYETFKEPVPMIFDEAAKRLHESQHECYACGERFKDDDVNLRKVRDHCHYTGKYRGALHNKCNLRLKTTRTIPVFLHNLTGYDCHLFVKRLADSPGDINCIPHNEEKYITFKMRVLVDTITKEDKEVNIYSCLKFVDTLNFMRNSLEKLVGNLEKPSFKNMAKYFQGEKLDLMLRKRVYPYEYMTGVERFWEKSLPPKEEFAPMLGAGVISDSQAMITPSHIFDEDFQHVQRFYEVFGCKNLADLTRKYCMSDVILLADVFESFIDVCLEKYGLKPSHYTTAPALSWDALLKMTGVKLELLTDNDMHLFFEEGIREGVSTIMNRYAKANNPYMGKVRGKTPKEVMEELRRRTNTEQQFSIKAVCEYFLGFSEQEIRDLRERMEAGEVFNPEEASVYIQYLDA